ncbi:hypothetical protein [Deinococcus aquiradiocola]|uniref:hypothetical protein n=1 Tax=Deinococcus aquiradiocola TaxID=393059 RepID=UPI00166D626C|nr:hypothetical protein [Deinococcus aquiradiocola]
MRRAIFTIPFLLVNLSFAGADASSAMWSRTGRMVVVTTAQQGKIITIRYTQAAKDTNRLALLRSCVEQRRGQYEQVTCVVYETAAQLNAVGSNGNRNCWSAAAISRGRSPIEVQPDNPALTLSPTCGGTMQLP